jgi:hypothetical protein
MLDFTHTAARMRPIRDERTLECRGASRSSMRTARSDARMRARNAQGGVEARGPRLSARADAG